MSAAPSFHSPRYSGSEIVCFVLNTKGNAVCVQYD